MRKKFPRIAKRTLPRRRRRDPLRSMILPPLRLGIYNSDGRLVSVEEIEDPRKRIALTMHQLDANYFALPLGPERKATPKSRKAVAQ
jgi:hypothetical protein